ncbi:MAG: hypothetical protein K2X81_04345 [Candidatus Obscuribacterales bacterium]|nr:hypothetical protein [Candidatus Obscuribacterales bacterium]
MHIELNKTVPLTGFEFPLSEELIAESLAEILIDSRVSIGFTCLENTSDVVIARSPWNHPLRDWTLLFVACRSEHCALVNDLLVTDGLPRLREWFIASNISLLDEPDLWQCFSLTIRFENGALLLFSSRSERPYKRPAEGWDPYKT